jgi:thiol-disulfide isomerase/thioredoxin
MAPTRNRRVTRRNGRKPRVLDVRSRGAVKAFENLIVQGPLTLVYVNAKWCGACHRFNKEVWSPLTKLKNKGLNLASVDSEYIGKTSLANVPRKFFPTLMLVGRDKKPAEFKDDNGEPTNAMPRKDTLSEDRETLSALVQAPMNHPLANANANANSQVNKEVLAPITTEAINPVNAEVERTILNMPVNMSAKRNTMNNTPASPFEKDNSTDEVPSMINVPSATAANKTFKSRPRSSAPDVASDLLASQSGSPTGTAAVLAGEQRMAPAAPQRGGSSGLLYAIREKVKSLDAVLGMRKDKKTRKSRV